MPVTSSARGASRDQDCCVRRNSSRVRNAVSMYQRVREKMRRERDRTTLAQEYFCDDESRDGSCRMRHSMLGGAGRNRL